MFVRFQAVIEVGFKPTLFKTKRCGTHKKTQKMDAQSVRYKTIILAGTMSS